MDKIKALEAADNYLYELNSEYTHACFEEVEKHSKHPRILKSDHPDAFKKYMFVFSYLDSNEDEFVRYVDLEGSRNADDVATKINNAIDFMDIFEGNN